MTNMKKILIFGDSNTFGYIPGTGKRFDESIRWAGIVKEKLKNSSNVIEDGVCDRTAFVENKKGEKFSSIKYLPKLLKQINFLDLIIFAIGTNDLQFQYNINEEEIEKGLKTLINISKSYTKDIIFILPVILNEDVLQGNFSFQFDKESIEKSKNIKNIFKNVLKNDFNINIKIFDANNFTNPSNIDGLHYDENSHKIIAERLLDFIKNEFIQNIL